MPDLPLAPWEMADSTPDSTPPPPAPQSVTADKQRSAVEKGVSAAVGLFGPYIAGVAGAPRFGQEIERGAAESAASALETADRPAEWLLGREEGPYSPRGVASKIRGLAPEAPPPAEGFQQKASDIAGQVIGAAPVGIAAWQGGVPWAMLSGQGVAESVAASKGQKATTWEKIRDSLLEGGQRAFMGWIMRQPWGAATSSLAAGAGAGVASVAEGRGHESTAINAGLNALFGLIGPSMSPADRAKIADVQQGAKAGDYRAFDDWLKDPQNIGGVQQLAKAMAMAARDRGFVGPKPPLAGSVEGPPRPPPQEGEFREPGRLPAHIERHIGKLSDWAAQNADLRDLAVEFGIVKSGLEFQNATPEQLEQIEFLRRRFNLPKMTPHPGPIPEAPRPGMKQEDIIKLGRQSGPRLLLPPGGDGPGEPPEPPVEPIPAGRAATSADRAEAWSRSAAEVATQITHMDRGNAIWRSIITPELENMWRGIQDNERILAMSDYMRGNTENMPPEIKKFFDVGSEALGRIWAEEEYAGVEHDWRENYWPGLWTDESRAAQMRPRGGGGPAFSKQKVFDDLMEGINAGLELKYTNPAVYLLARLEHGELWKSRVQAMKYLEQVGVAGRDAAIAKDARGNRPFEWDGYQEVDLAGTRYLLHPQAAKVFRRGLRMDKQAISELVGLDKYSRIGKAVDTAYGGWMSIRNATVPTKLALSAFHPFHVSSIGAKSEIAGLLSQRLNNRISNKDFINAITFSGRGRYESGKLMSEDFSKRLEDLGTHERIAQWANLAGGFTPQRPSIYEIKAEQKLRRLFNDTIPTLEQQLNVKNVGTLSRLFNLAPQQARGLALQMGRIIESFQHPLFGEWIPAMKQAAYWNETAAFLKGHPELLAATEASTIKLKAGLRKVQESIDNRFGEMQYDKVFMPTLLRKTLVASLLSVGWQLGFLREFGGGAIDAAKNIKGYYSEDPVLSEVTTRSAYALTYAAAALPMAGIATYIMTGTRPEGKDWLYPRLPDGTRINTPLFTREFGAMWFHWQKEGLVPGVISYASNKTVTMVSSLLDIYKNEDYFGHQIYDERAALFTQVEQMGEYFGFNTTVPISVESIIGKGIDDPAKIALSLGGFSPAPKYVTETKAEAAIDRSYKKFGSPHKTPYEEVHQKNDKYELSQQFKQARQSGSPEDKRAYQDARKGYLEKYKATQTKRGLNESENLWWSKPNKFGEFESLPPSEQRALLNEFTSAERETYRWAARTLIRKDFPMVDEETFRLFTPDEQKSAIDAAPKGFKGHYLDMAATEVRKQYGLDTETTPPSAPWEAPRPPWETIQ